MNPRFPIYIPSRGRAGSRTTMRYLDVMGVPYSVIVEADEYAAYAAVMDPAKLLVLDPCYQATYAPCMELQPGQSLGSGPARNFAWEHAVRLGAERHWIIDDNIAGFYRLNRNTKFLAGDGTVLRCMEDFVLRYTNVALAGPHYEMFVARKEAVPPFTVNTRIYSCILVRNDLPMRWRCRYNEDTDLSLRVLKRGWCTILFNAFLQNKVQTQVMAGGNMDAFYAREGTRPKSRMLAALHPDVVKVVWRYGRWHHHIDYRRRFRANKLVRRPDVTVADGVDEYGLQLVDRVPLPRA